MIDFFSVMMVAEIHDTYVKDNWCDCSDCEDGTVEIVIVQHIVVVMNIVMVMVVQIHQQQYVMVQQQMVQIVILMLVLWV